jgi:hypothetical protein
MKLLTRIGTALSFACLVLGFIFMCPLGFDPEEEPDDEPPPE